MGFRVTVARDKRVRVFDIESMNAAGSTDGDTPQHCRVIRCHTGAVKRIVTESSPDSFLTVSEVRYPVFRDTFAVLMYAVY